MSAIQCLGATAGVVLMLPVLSSCVYHGPATGDSASIEAKGSIVKHIISGPFDVKLAPQADGAGIGDPAIGRMSLDKQFHGDLEATSKGQMLGVRTAVKNSAGYVAMERVVGTLAGRTGSFVLQHSSTMTKGEQQQSVTVVPDSGTDGLMGLAGTMTIEITGGKHLYHFEYWLDETPRP